MSQGSFNPKIIFLSQKVRPDTHTRARTNFQGFRSFSFNLTSRIGPTMKSIQPGANFHRGFHSSVWLRDLLVMLMVPFSAARWTSSHGGEPGTDSKYFLGAYIHGFVGSFIHKYMCGNSLGSMNLYR